MSHRDSACGCAAGEEPVHFRIGAAGEAQCTICGWIWVQAGWNESRLPLFSEPEPASVLPQVATPTTAELREWFQAGSA